MTHASAVPRFGVMLISAREATYVLASIGLDREATRRVLRAGLAGPAQLVGGTHVFDGQRVSALAARQPVATAGAPTTFVARVSPRQGLDVTASFEDQVAAVRRGWPMSRIGPIVLRHAIELDGPMPFVATVGGLVAMGADIVGVAFDSDRIAALDLRAPGPWFDLFRERRLPTGPGHPWLLWPRHGGTATGARPWPARDRRNDPLGLQQCDP